MALLGTGAICIWNDITPEGRDEFYAWHLNEHMPERAAIPGFLRSRRFIAAGRDTSPEFFTLYETRDASVLTGADYLARLNAPTPWTKSATQAFRNTSRALTSVLASLGPGAGGSLATLRFDLAHAGRDALVHHIRADLLPGVAGGMGIAGLHLCATDTTASASRTAESRERTDIQTAPSGIILVEGCGEEAVAEAAGALAGTLAGALNGPVLLGLYRLEFQC